MEKKRQYLINTFEDSFTNPFEDINANGLNPEQINEYWCSPFSNGLLTDFDENRFRTSRIPIILQGSRGSGKTMILKYFAFHSQLERAKKTPKKSYLDVVKNEGSIGFYFRCDDSFIKTFQALFKSHAEDTTCFEYYLELVFCEKLLLMIDKISENNELQEIDLDDFAKISIKNTFDELEFEIVSYQDLNEFIHTQIKYVDNYKNRAAFTNEDFNPQAIFPLFSLSENMIIYLKSHVSQFRDVIFVLMIDEFENLTADLQRRFNTLIKFVHLDITLRIGRRSEGIVTTETVNKEEYLRKNHDYLLASLEKEYDKKDNNTYRDYFLNIAQKRFSSCMKDMGSNYNILSILGDKENLDLECQENCRGKDRHIMTVLRQAKELDEDKELCSEIAKIISNKEKPIAETLNALWVIRKKRSDMSYLQAAEFARQAMEGYFNKEENEAVKKYRADYINKYRYAITVFICSVYKRPKLYYGFNAISYLANGNTRTFINLCRTIISDALFYERSNFFKTGSISKETQSRAIHNFAQEEFDDVCSIITYGYNIRNLVFNLGNMLAIYHKDKKIRCPETNQFTFDESTLSEEDFRFIKMAQSWAMIIKKERPQRATAGNNQKVDLFHINKIFYPIFNISYRTRGGVNLSFSSEEIHEMLRKQDVLRDIEEIEDIKKHKNSKKKNSDNSQIAGQLSLFD